MGVVPTIPVVLATVKVEDTCAVPNPVSVPVPLVWIDTPFPVELETTALALIENVELVWAGSAAQRKNKGRAILSTTT